MESEIAAVDLLLWFLQGRHRTFSPAASYGQSAAVPRSVNSMPDITGGSAGPAAIGTRQARPNPLQQTEPQLPQRRPPCRALPADCSSGGGMGGGDSGGGGGGGGGSSSFD